ncbi:MAG: ion channel [Planctomycetota bacterium]
MGHQHGTFGWLLVSLLGLCLVAPTFEIAGDPGGAAVGMMLIGVFYAWVLWSTIRAIGGKQRDRLIVVVLSVGAIAPRFGVIFMSGEWLWLVAYSFDLIVLGFVTWHLVTGLFRPGRVTAGLIAASLCAYLMIGLFFSSVYGLLDTLNPGSFLVNGEPGLTQLHRTEGTALYFSLVTLTTLGYGDVLPQNSLARMLAAVQAVIGQVYLTVLVARLVGLHIAASTPGGQATGTE